MEGEDQEEENITSESKSESTPKKKKENSYQSYTIGALNKMLEDVLQKEDYEKAAKIRDEINRRKAN